MRSLTACRSRRERCFWGKQATYAKPADALSCYLGGNFQSCEFKSDHPPKIRNELDTTYQWCKCRWRFLLLPNPRPTCAVAHHGGSALPSLKKKSGDATHGIPALHHHQLSVIHISLLLGRQVIPARPWRFSRRARQIHARPRSFLLPHSYFTSSNFNVATNQLLISLCYKYDTNIK